MRLLFAILLLSGCGVIDNKFGGQIAYFGAAQDIDLPYYDADKFIINRNVEIAGAWLDIRADGEPTGFGLGYRDLQITAAPLDCSLVIFVESDTQLQSVRALTEQFYKEGKSPCILKSK